MPIQIAEDGFDVLVGDTLVLRHRSDTPCLFVGRGEERMEMYRGNFDIEDYVVERTPLTHADVSGDTVALSAAPGQPVRLRVSVSMRDGNAVVALPVGIGTRLHRS